MHGMGCMATQRLRVCLHLYHTGMCIVHCTARGPSYGSHMTVRLPNLA
jgi:hypothetical protein